MAMVVSIIVVLMPTVVSTVVRVKVVVSIVIMPTVSPLNIIISIVMMAPVDIFLLSLSPSSLWRWLFPDHHQHLHEGRQVLGWSYH